MNKLRDGIEAMVEILKKLGILSENIEVKFQVNGIKNILSFEWETSIKDIKDPNKPNIPEMKLNRAYVENVLGVRSNVGTKYRLHYVDYGENTWTVPIELTGRSVKAIIRDFHSLDRIWLIHANGTEELFKFVLEPPKPKYPYPLSTEE